MRHAILALAAILATVAAGCVLGPGELARHTAEDPEAAPGPDLAVDVTADEEVLEPGAVLNLTYRLENVGNRSYSYEHPGCPPARVDAYARTPDGRTWLYTYRNGTVHGACALRTVTLGPGEALEETVQWNGRSTPDRPDPHEGDRVTGNRTLEASLVRADDGPVFPGSVTVQVQG